MKPGSWDEIYSIHKEEEHKGTKIGTPTNSAATYDKKIEGVNTFLKLQPRLKEVMCTNLQPRGADVDKLFEQALEN